jgi:hypothetical protein
MVDNLGYHSPPPLYSNFRRSIVASLLRMTGILDSSSVEISKIVS